MTHNPHRLRIRVYWEDTDAGGLVYHSNYLNFAERGRTEFVRELGLTQSTLADGGRGYAFAVADAQVKFLRSAKLDDELEVETRLIDMGGASANFAQSIKRVDDGTELVRLNIRLGFIALDGGRPARMPADTRAKFMERLNERLR